MSSTDDPYGFNDDTVEQPTVAPQPGPAPQPHQQQAGWPGHPQQQWAQQPQWGQQPYRPPVQPSGGGCGRAVAIFTALLNIVMLLIMLGIEMIADYVDRELGDQGAAAALVVFVLIVLLTLIFGLISIGVTRGLPRLGAIVGVLALLGAGVWVAVALMGTTPLAGLSLLDAAKILAAMHGLAALLLFIPSSRRR
ncbi:hypothetical protein BW730_07510 [Tessaracoccus aquimaris]|uniref:Uncharacterized protein n=1 Tax=Tessaracoccus aquimaris TaxID=1332264 RepID=A0A1Q2CMM6_9ACTN|nr:hypothetical protein [Tessaracoccus aquimaris]AQP47369.1 hypothetical protein BW730_07510 [Tessaracoccus aquimaris]